MNNDIKKAIKLNLLDKVVNFFDPVHAVDRIKARSMINTASNAGFITFGSSRKSMRGAFATNNSADLDVIPKIEAMRMSSRDLYMNAPVATGAIRRSRTNIVGYGLSLQPRIDRKKLKLTDEQAEAWELNTAREFALWSESKNCDITKMQNFSDLQGLVLMSALLSGDCFVMLPYVESYDHPYELCLKVIEADLVSNPYNLLETNDIAGGVEVDKNGAPIAYHVQKTHPGAIYPSYEWSRVPIYGEKSSRKNVLHIMDKERPGQRRGVPMLAPVIEKIKQLTRLSEAELTAAVVTSFFTAFIKTDVRDNSDPVNDGYTGTGNSVKNNQSLADANVSEMGSGTIVDLTPGESIELADPKRPNAAFEPFFHAMSREIGAAIEIPHEVLTLQFTASYSASKAALIEAWKFFKSRRAWLEREFCKPVYEAFLWEAVSKGRISAFGFFTDPSIRKAWSDSNWSGPGQGQLNPVQETRAALMRVQGNISTLSKETAAIEGDNWSTMINDRSREINVLKSKGLTQE